LKKSSDSLITLLKRINIHHKTRKILVQNYWWKRIHQRRYCCNKIINHKIFITKIL